MTCHVCLMLCTYLTCNVCIYRRMCISVFLFTSRSGVSASSSALLETSTGQNNTYHTDVNVIIAPISHINSGRTSNTH